MITHRTRNESDLTPLEVRIPCGAVELKIVPGATHLFEEPGALEAVARLAADWFRRHLHSHSEATD
jgi:hypothetical protein